MCGKDNFPSRAAAHNERIRRRWRRSYVHYCGMCDCYHLTRRKPRRLKNWRH